MKTICQHCGKPPGNKAMTPEEFQATFQVGDMIAGWQTGLQVRITAIGKKRFLYEDDRSKGGEGVAMQAATWKWRKVHGPNNSNK